MHICAYNTVRKFAVIGMLSMEMDEGWVNQGTDLEKHDLESKIKG